MANTAHRKWNLKALYTWHQS